MKNPDLKYNKKNHQHNPTKNSEVMHLSMRGGGGGGLGKHGNLTVTYIPRAGILFGHHAFDLSIYKGEEK